MRRTLDTIYISAGWLAAFFILAIATLVSAQVLLNFGTRVFDLPLPSTIPSYADFSGFMLAAASFLAMPYTFRSGGHIRVSLVTMLLPPPLRMIAEIAVLVFAAFLIGFASFYIGALIYESWHFSDVSPGIVAVPLWIPQMAMAVGMGLLFIAIVDSLIETLRRGAPVIENAEEI